MVTRRKTADATQLTRYLLGRMGPDEQERVEQRYLSDPAFHAELRAAERDLIDQYVHRELPDVEAFERHFLSSPQRRQKVEFARALMQSLAETSDRHVVRGHGGWWARSPFPRLFTSSALGWQFAAAISAAILIGGWLVLNREQQPPPGQIAAAPPAPGPRPAAPPSAGRSPDRRPPSPPAPASPPVATVVLIPGLTRDGDQTRTLTIARDSDIRLELSLEPGDYDTYRVVIATADGVEIWRQDGSTTVRTSSGDAIIVTLPGARFNDDDYVIRVAGISGSGEVDDAASYYFRARTR